MLPPTRDAIVGETDAVPAPVIPLDLRGLSCPDTVLVLGEEAERLVIGQELDVITDVPSATADFVRWAEGTDFELFKIRSLPDGSTGYRFRRVLLD